MRITVSLRFGLLAVACAGCIARTPQTPVPPAEASADEPPKQLRPVEIEPESELPAVARPPSHPTPGAAIAPSPARSTAQRISLDLKDADVRNVLRLIAEVSKLNIAATEEVQGKVTLRLFDVPWDEALGIVLRAVGLDLQQEGNFVRVSTLKRLREEREELQKARMAQATGDPLQTVYLRLNYAKAEHIAEILAGPSGMADPAAVSGAVATRAGPLSERGSVVADDASNSVVVRDVAAGVEAARELVRELDVQTPQVLIESRIVEATSDLGRDLGIQWGYKYERSEANGHPTGSTFPHEIGVGGSGLGSGTSGLPWVADFPAANVIPGMGSAVGAVLGGIDDVHTLEVRLTALERDGKAKVISRPRVVTLNNVPATIKSLTVLRVKLPSSGTVVQTGAGSATSGAHSVATEKIETGIVLVVTPQVSADGFVMLDLFAKSSQADFTRTVDEIPTEISREASSRVLVRDGQTVVLGGIYRETTANQNTGVPFLRDVPVLGAMFRSSGTTNRREDLLVFLTPHIVDSSRLGTADD